MSDTTTQLIRCLAMYRAGVLTDTITTETLSRLAGQYGVHPRTIRRDLQALERAGYGPVRWASQDTDRA